MPDDSANLAPTGENPILPPCPTSPRWSSAGREAPAHRFDLRKPWRRAGARRDAPLRRGHALRARARERSRPERLRRPVDGVPDERQRRRAALLARRVRARQRRLVTAVDPVLQLRQGRQEGRAARVDPRPGDAPTRSRPPAPAAWSRWTCTRRRSRASSRSPSTTSTACPTSRTRSGARLADPVVVSPDAGYAKMARRYAARLGAGYALADKTRPGHGEEVEVTDVIGDVSGRDTVLVDDFIASGATLIEVAPKLLELGARSVYAAATHGALLRQRDRAARREPDRARDRHRHGREPARPAGPKCRSSRSRRSSPRRSGASTGARASASSSRTAARPSG